MIYIHKKCLCKHTIKLYKYPLIKYFRYCILVSWFGDAKMKITGILLWGLFRYLVIFDYRYCYFYH